MAYENIQKNIIKETKTKVEGTRPQKQEPLKLVAEKEEESSNKPPNKKRSSQKKNIGTH